jgi:predicted nuclease of predicted toxin-antitoxin system
MDVHVPRAITRALRLRGVDVLTAQEEGTAQLADGPLLDRADALGRALFTRDEDFLAETDGRQRRGEPFVGVIYAHQLRVGIGRCIADLERIAKACDPADLAGRVWHLPLR